jgi:hypothetical protein
VGKIERRCYWIALLVATVPWILAAAGKSEENVKAKSITCEELKINDEEGHLMLSLSAGGLVSRGNIMLIGNESCIRVGTLADLQKNGTSCKLDSSSVTLYEPGQAGFVLGLSNPRDGGSGALLLQNPNGSSRLALTATTRIVPAGKTSGR